MCLKYLLSKIVVESLPIEFMILACIIVYCIPNGMILSTTTTNNLIAWLSIKVSSGSCNNGQLCGVSVMVILVWVRECDISLQLGLWLVICWYSLHASF